MPLYTPIVNQFDTALTVGESTISRSQIVSNALSTNTTTLRLTYFTAAKTETTTQVRVLSGGTAASATPTLVRIGLFLIAADGGGTLVASTVNDTALFAAANTAYTKSWSSSYDKVAGQRYAMGVLVVTAGTAPTIAGQSVSTATELGIAPRLAGTLTSQNDLPSSFVVGSVSDVGTRLYGAILP